MQPVWNFGFCNIVSLLFPILYDHPDHSRMRFYSCFCLEILRRLRALVLPYVARAKSFWAMILIVDFTSAASQLKINLPAPDGSRRYCDINRGNTAPNATYKMLLLFSTILKARVEMVQRVKITNYLYRQGVGGRYQYQYYMIQHSSFCCTSALVSVVSSHRDIIHFTRVSQGLGCFGTTLNESPVIPQKFLQFGISGTALVPGLTSPRNEEPERA